MLFKYRSNFWISLLILLSAILGCVHRVPPEVAPDKERSQTSYRREKIWAKVGIYLRDDLKKYVYKRRKMGATLKVDIGESLPRVLTQMASAMMFEDVVFVNSLPPYNNNFKQDVDAVIEPEILYFYGNTVGTVTGYIEAKIKMRITVYDLAGKVLWQDDAIGVSRSEDLNLAGAFWGDMDRADKTGYEAAFSAAVRITENFSEDPQKALYTFAEVDRPAALKNGRMSELELFEKYYRKGRLQYERKNFYQALRSFEKAMTSNPGDLSTLFYMGVCYTYLGEKNKALEKFRKVFELNPASQEAGDSKKWIELLEEPLKVAVVGLNKDSLIQKALIDSLMYETIEVTFLGIPPNGAASSEFDLFLDKCRKKDAKVVLFCDFDYTVRPAVTNPQSGGDTAMEYISKISVKVYSTKKKELKTEININDTASTIGRKSVDEERAIKEQLLKKGAAKLVLRLLENDVF